MDLKDIEALTENLVEKQAKLEVQIEEKIRSDKLEMQVYSRIIDRLRFLFNQHILYPFEDLEDLKDFIAMIEETCEEMGLTG